MAFVLFLNVSLTSALLSCTLILSWGLLSIEAQGFEEEGEKQGTKVSHSYLSIHLKHGVSIKKKEVNETRQTVDFEEWS